MIKKQMRLSSDEYRNMSPKEAKEYFDWFKANIPNEIEKLNKVSKIDKSVVLDYSPESLIALEKWFLPLRVYVKLSKKQILEDYANAPDFILQEMLIKRYAPSVRTVDLAVMVAVYFGEVFVRNNPDLYWDYVKKPKSSAYFNEPVIYGFTPPDMKFPGYVTVLSWCVPTYSNSRRGDKPKKSLYEWYKHWLENKELFWDPDYSAEKLKILEERRSEERRRQSAKNSNHDPGSFFQKIKKRIFRANI